MDGSAVHFFCDHQADLAVSYFHKCIFQPGKIGKRFLWIHRHKDSSRSAMADMEQKFRFSFRKPFARQFPFQSKFCAHGYAHTQIRIAFATADSQPMNLTFRNPTPTGKRIIQPLSFHRHSSNQSICQMYIITSNQKITPRCILCARGVFFSVKWAEYPNQN